MSIANFNKTLGCFKCDVWKFPLGARMWKRGRILFVDYANIQCETIDWYSSQRYFYGKDADVLKNIFLLTWRFTH